jgi:hypothetical protein
VVLEYEGEWLHSSTNNAGLDWYRRWDRRRFLHVCPGVMAQRLSVALKGGVAPNFVPALVYVERPGRQSR